LEADGLESLIEAAGDLDRLRWKEGREDLAREIQRLRDRKQWSWKRIARSLEVAESTAIYLYRRLEDPPGQMTLVRRAIVATLGCAGLRNTELCSLDWVDLVFAHRKIRVGDSKTPAGVREVAMTPRLLEELLAYRSTIGDIGHEDPAFPTGRGTRRDKDNVNARVLKPAMLRARELRAKRGLPPLPPGVTVHTLRRTYVSLMLAAGADLRWVRGQVGHEDAKMTLEVYTQILPTQGPRALHRSVRPAHGGCDSVDRRSQDQRRARPRCSRIPRKRAQLRPRIRPEHRHTRDLNPPESHPLRRNPRKRERPSYGASRPVRNLVGLCEGGPRAREK
jgi:integrase